MDVYKSVTLLDTPAHGEKYINKTLNSLWRVHKSRVKKDHYTKYDSDEKRTENRPHDIPLEDFKILLKYRADEGLQISTLLTDHLLGKMQLVGTHMLTPTHLVVKLLLKLLEDAIQKRIETIDEVLKEGGDADAVLPDGKHGPDWLVGRQGSLLALENTPAIPQPSVDELPSKITRDLESQIEAKVNRKVQENMTWFLKKLGEANPTLKFDIGDFCAPFSSDQDETGTPITQTPWSATS
ncbi:hypothetical protein OROMI_012182 [Orobanche minor]